MIERPQTTVFTTPRCLRKPFLTTTFQSFKKLKLPAKDSKDSKVERMFRHHQLQTKPSFDNNLEQMEYLVTPQLTSTDYYLSTRSTTWLTISTILQQSKKKCLHH